MVGEAGVGKSALIEGLALRIIAGQVPDKLRDTDIMTLDLGALQAGASVKGEFEKRFKGLMAEVIQSPKPATRTCLTCSTGRSTKGEMADGEGRLIDCKMWCSSSPPTSASGTTKCGT